MAPGIKSGLGGVVELGEVVFEGFVELGVEAGGEGVEGLVGFALVHEVHALAGGVFGAYEKVFREIACVAGFFLADFECPHGIERAGNDGLLDVLFVAFDSEELDHADELGLGVGFEVFVAEIQDGELVCVPP